MIHFISDLHLAFDTPKITQRFLRFLEKCTGQKLYIFGDFFEIWAGDDCLEDPKNSFVQEILNALQNATKKGVQIFLMHGNRDFLIGARFAAEAKITLLPDPFVLQLNNAKLLLSHGDALCTEDVAYQAFRAQTRDKNWQAAFLQKPFAERESIAKALRAQSEAAKKAGQKSEYSQDVSDEAVLDLLAKNPSIHALIHGHTHKPNNHQHLINGQIIPRLVLSDWSDDFGEALYLDDTQNKAFSHADLQRLKID